MADDRLAVTGNALYMRKTGLKALVTLLIAGRRSRRHINWTLWIAILSTIVTIGLVVLYFMEQTPE